MKNKTVLVTGAATGIGRSTAELFAAMGYQVAIGCNHSFAEGLQFPLIDSMELEARLHRGRGQPAGKGQQSSQTPTTQKGRSTSGRVGGSLGFESRDVGISTENAQSSLDIVNYDVREAIAAAERAAARSSDPAATFSRELSDRILGPDGMRNRYLQDADSGRATFDVTGPLTSVEQNAVLKGGRFSTDIEGSPGDGDSSFKKR